MSNVHEPDKKVFSPAEAAEWLGLVSVGAPDPEGAVRHLHKKRGLHGCKIGGRLCFLRHDLEEYTTTMRMQSFVKGNNDED